MRSTTRRLGIVGALLRFANKRLHLRALARDHGAAEDKIRDPASDELRQLSVGSAHELRQLSASPAFDNGPIPSAYPAALQRRVESDILDETLFFRS